MPNITTNHAITYTNYKLQVTGNTIFIQQAINYVFVFCNWNGLREGSLYRPTLYVSKFKSKAVFDSDFQSVLDYGFLVRGTNIFRIPIVSGIADSLSWMPRNSDFFEQRHSRFRIPQAKISRIPKFGLPGDSLWNSRELDTPLYSDCSISELHEIK